jgi:hypothetical protein
LLIVGADWQMKFRKPLHSFFCTEEGYCEFECKIPPKRQGNVIIVFFLDALITRWGEIFKYLSSYQHCIPLPPLILWCIVDSNKRNIVIDNSMA